MASVKIVLRKEKQKKDGTYPIAIRITKDRRSRYVHTGYSIHTKDWNEVKGKVRRSHQNSSRLNNLLLKKLSEANDLLIQSETSQETVSAKEIKNKIKRAAKPVSFFHVADERIQSYRAKGTFSVAIADQSKIKNIRKFVGDKELYFEEITEPFLSRFKVFCASKLKHNTRTITNHLILIRTLFNVAIKEGIVGAKYYPFGGDKEKIRLGSGLKIGLTKEEVRRIENLELDAQTPIWHARNVWLFSFYLAGIRISDTLKLKWSDFQDGRLLYVMNKNEKPVSLKVPQKGLDILESYKASKSTEHGFVFPYMSTANLNNQRDVYVKSRNGARLINDYLKRIAHMCDIDKNLSNHIARHTFGNIAGDTVHPLMLQKLYRHSDLKTTINYQANFIHKDADDALDSVVGS